MIITKPHSNYMTCKPRCYKALIGSLNQQMQFTLLTHDWVAVSARMRYILEGSQQGTNAVRWHFSMLFPIHNNPVGRQTMWDSSLCFCPWKPAAVLLLHTTIPGCLSFGYQDHEERGLPSIMSSPSGCSSRCSLWHGDLLSTGRFGMTLVCQQQIRASLAAHDG